MKSNGRIEQSRMPFAGAPGYGPKRVWLKNRPVPGLAMTRSIGDMAAASVGVIAKPEFTRFELTGKDKILVMASDGLWDRMSNHEVMSVL